MKSYEILVKLKENLSKSILSILELVTPAYTLRDKQLELILIDSLYSYNTYLCHNTLMHTHIHACTHVHTHTLNYNGYTAI